MKNNVRRLRLARGLTQAELAEALGVSIPTIQNWEAEKTDMTGYSLAMMCDFFSVSPDEVYGSGQKSDEWKYRIELIGIYDNLPSLGKRVLIEEARAVSDVFEEEIQDALNEQRNLDDR